MRMKTLVLVALPLVGGAMLGAATSARPESQCVVAKRWVETHASELPRTLSAISLHNAAFRRAIYLALPKGVQIALWQEQFAAYRSMPDMSADQRVFLDSASIWFAHFLQTSTPSTKGDTTTDLGRFGEQAIAMFGRERAVMIFANIGINTPEQTAQPVPTQAGGTCSCNNGPMNWCGSTWFVQCLAGDPPCTESAHGCGWGLYEGCNGVCTYGIYP